VSYIKLLFICSRNKWRSLTAEKIFNGVNGYDVRSAGTEANARIKVTNGHIGWADIIFVMERKHSTRLKNKFGNLLNDKKIICLTYLMNINLWMRNWLNYLGVGYQSILK